MAMKAAAINIKERFPDKIIKIEEKSDRRIYIHLDPVDIPLVAEFLFKELGLRFATATGIDTPAGIEILYHFSLDKAGNIITLCALIQDKNKPKVKSIASIITGAEWIEREIWELLGVDFIGHPNLKRLLLADEWPEGKYPLRKEK
jgi:Ni,Fe-hydrogenase III component G